jgi:hypothetical protein
MARNKLTDETKAFVVKALACWDPPSVVARALQEEYGVELARSSVEAYDPTRRAGRRLAERWRQLFQDTRSAFLEDASAIGVAHQVVRLRALDRMAQEAEAAGDFALAARLLAQAAREWGGCFTNRRGTRADGDDRVNVKGMNDGQLDARIDELMRKAGVAGPVGGKGASHGGA